jgi:hypothetical protein
VGENLVKAQDDGKDSCQDQDQLDVSVRGRVIVVHESNPNWLANHKKAQINLCIVEESNFENASSLQNYSSHQY